LIEYYQLFHVSCDNTFKVEEEEFFNVFKAFIIIRVK